MRIRKVKAFVLRSMLTESEFNAKYPECAERMEKEKQGWIETINSLYISER